MEGMEVIGGCSYRTTGSNEMGIITAYNVINKVMGAPSGGNVDVVG